MTVEIALLISLVSVAFAVYSGIANLKRNGKKDTAEDAAQLTTVIVKLENINTGITEIKAEMKNVKSDVQELRDRLIVVEQSTKSAHKRLDGLVGNDKE
ncbi:MAG: hypothetical protein ACLR1M_11150 [Oscillospiraceae bacterium]